MSDKNLTPGQEGDAVAVYLAEARTRAERELRYICVAPEGPAWSCEDVPRLLGALEAVRAVHRRDHHRWPSCEGCGMAWPCQTYAAITAELTGKDGTDEH